jgi:hypothetical protein
MCPTSIGAVMFRKHWWSGKTVSDEGFSITFTSRNTLLYEYGGKTMTVRTEGDGREIDVFQNSIVHWTNDPSTIDGNTLVRIADNVAHALESRGLKVRIVTG